MNSVCVRRGGERGGERGSIIIMTAVFMLLLFLMVGLCIDVSRIYMIRAEMQNAADAAALTAARELNGGDGGIDDAVARAIAIVNSQGFAKAGVSVAKVEFAVNLYDDPYIPAYDSSDPAVTKTAAKAQAENIRFVKVTTQAHKTNILFGVNALGPDHTEARLAVAGMSVTLSGLCDFFPMAVALDTIPAPNTELTLRFTQGTGNSADLADRDYIILEVPQITGSGQVETALLAAGAPNYCKKLGDNINMTPSSNTSNGPRASGDGVNTRFDIRENGYANQLKDTVRFPPDLNVREDITYYEYINRTAVTLPDPTNPSYGEDERRVIVAPIIRSGSYPSYTTNIIDWGIFFLKRRSFTTNGQCDAAAGCGSLPVEYVGRANIGSVNGPTSLHSSLTVPVLYR